MISIYLFCCCYIFRYFLYLYTFSFIFALITLSAILLIIMCNVPPSYDKKNLKLNVNNDKYDEGGHHMDFFLFCIYINNSLLTFYINEDKFRYPPSQHIFSCTVIFSRIRGLDGLEEQLFFFTDQYLSLPVPGILR